MNESRSGWTVCPMCGKRTVHSYYNLKSGKKMFACYARIDDPQSSCPYLAEEPTDKKRRRR